MLIGLTLLNLVFYMVSGEDINLAGAICGAIYLLVTARDKDGIDG